MNILTLKEQLNQMFILGFDGEIPSRQLLNYLENGLGGVILFTNNIKSLSQTKDVTRIINKHAKYKPFISIDEEGGRVERTENLFGGKKFLSAKFAKEKGDDFVLNQTKEISELLKNLGFNLNFAPVLDVNTNPQNPIIGERAFSNNTDEVIKYGKIVVSEYLRNGIMPCTKHFPGHGDANKDSHLTLPEINLELNDYIQNHVRVFKEVQAPMVMIAHLYCKAFDSEVIPSSISKNVLTLLKNTCPHSLIISDDMVMGGIVQNLNPVETVIKAIENGINLLLYRSSDDKTLDIIEEIYNIALKSPSLQQKIQESYNKILKIKKEYLC